jgi:hypothetical protein
LNDVVLVHPSVHTTEAEVLRVVRKLLGIGRAVLETGFAVCEAKDPVELASKLAGMPGVDKVCIAKKVPSLFPAVSKAISDAGKAAVLPGQRFFVKVLASNSEKLDFTTRDVEFYSTGTLTAKLASINARPAKSEVEAEKTILAYIGRSSYVCIQTVDGVGGALYGSHGRACSVICGPLSAVSCLQAIRSGFDIDMFLLYDDDDALRENAKLADKISKAKVAERDTIHVGQAVLPDCHDDAVRLLLLERLALNAAISMPEKRTVLSLSLAFHPQWFIESAMQEIYAAGKLPYAPLLFLSREPGLDERYLSLAKRMRAVSAKSLQKYVGLIKDTKTLRLKVGPDYLYNIIDSV